MFTQVARAKVRPAGSFVQYTIHFVAAPLRMAVQSPESSLKLPHYLRNGSFRRAGLAVSNRGDSAPDSLSRFSATPPQHGAAASFCRIRSV